MSKQDDADTLKFTAPCGCIKLLVVNQPDLVKECKRNIAWALSIGCRVDTLLASAVRSEAGGYTWGCDVCKPPKKRKAEALQMELL